MITMRNTAPSVRARQLGAELRRSRTTTGLAADQVAKRLGFSPSKVSRIEFGRRGAKVEDVAAMLALCGVTGQSRAELLELSQEVASGARGWWQRREMSANQRTLIELESTATRIVNFENFLIPGLLQTGEYSRAVLRDAGMHSEDRIQDLMVTRLARHAVLRKERPPHLVALIHEVALRQNIGGPDVMRRQLDYILELIGRRAAMTVRVIPMNARTNPGVLGPMVWIDSADHSPVIYLETRTSNLFLEDRPDIDVHTQALRAVSAAALDERESAMLIAAIMRVHEGNGHAGTTPADDMAEEQP